MNKIKLIALILGVTFLFGADVKNFENLSYVNQKQIDNVEKFSDLSRIKKEDNVKNLESFQALNKHAKETYDIDKQLKSSQQMYNGTDKSFLNKKEYKKLVSQMGHVRKQLKKELNSEYILYLFSKSVPDAAYFNVLHSVGILQENGVRIKTNQYLIGKPDEFKKMMEDKREYLKQNITEKEGKYIFPNVQLKIDPRLFKEFKAKNVPVMVYARCKGKIPKKSNCSFDYMVRGSVSLAEFFYMMSDKDPRFKKYYQYLIGNKISN